ncbi:hypothetical protein ACFYZE_28015 [Streptomyces sp. NPDC001796]|uniref:hypothetical protein n=1 Tax=Streptomyces sp. NPDC001796 TaxID=3364609 RepID=UPI0036ACE335
MDAWVVGQALPLAAAVGQVLPLAAVVVLAAGALRIGSPCHRAVVRGSAPGGGPAAADAVPASADRH